MSYRGCFVAGFSQDSPSVSQGGPLADFNSGAYIFRYKKQIINDRKRVYKRNTFRQVPKYGYVCNVVLLK